MSDPINSTNTQDANDLLLSSKRPARALIGWLSDEHAANLFHGGQGGIVLTDEEREFLRSAREHIRKRARFSEHEEAVSPIPEELADYIKALRETPRFEPYRNEGWDFKLVDITKVRALQPQIFVNESKKRVSRVRVEDMKSIAEITIPVPSKTQMPAQFDQIRNAWVFSSRNPNLRVAGHFAAEAQQGMNVFGFMVEIAVSLMQVAKIENKYVLRDGYHRALGLLEAGITNLPALVREFGAYDDLGLPAAALLPRQLYMGERPPVIADYIDDAVSREIFLPATQKTIVIQGLEINHVS